MRTLINRLAVLSVLALLALPAAGASARSGLALFVDGPSSTNIRLTLHFKEIVAFTTRCRVGTVFGGTYKTLDSFKRLKANRAHRFYAHLTMNYSFYNANHETEEAPVPVTLSAHFTVGHAFLRGSITNSKCNGGKPLAFKTDFSGYEL